MLFVFAGWDMRVSDSSTIGDDLNLSTALDGRRDSQLALRLLLSFPTVSRPICRFRPELLVQLAEVVLSLCIPVQRIL